MQDEFVTQFEARGYLASSMEQFTQAVRDTNSSWFALLDDLSDALQQTAFKNMEVAATTSGSFEQRSVAHCVLLRAAGSLQGTILMAERGMVVEARTLARSVLEDAFCMAALHDKPSEFLEHLKEDHAAARKGQAKALLSHAPRDKFDEAGVQAILASMPKLRNLGMAELAQIGPLATQYLAYRQLSNDGAHPSATSLERHMSYNEERTEWRGFKVGPARDGDIVLALNFAAMAALPIGIGYTVIMDDTEGNDQFGELSARYHALPGRAGA